MIYLISTRSSHKQENVIFFVVVCFWAALPYSCSKVWEDQIPGDSSEELGGDLCLGTQTIPQVYGLQGMAYLIISHIIIWFTFNYVGPVPFKRNWTYLRECMILWQLCIYSLFLSCQSFTELQHRPQLVDLTVEEGQRLKVIYGSSVGFHVIDVDSGNPYDIYIPSHVSLCFISNHPFELICLLWIWDL